MKLSVLMPVYNEAPTLEDILERVLAVPLPEDMEREIVAVDDGSTDGSWELLQSLARKEPRIRALRHGKNQGKGASIRTAVQAAAGDFAIIQDADLEYDPRDYPRLLAPILENEADVVYGSRFASAQYRRVLFFWHGIANRLLTTLSNMFTDLNLTDIETGYKAFRMSVLKTIPIRSNRFGFEPEITAKVAKRRLKIFETAINYSGRTYLEGKKIGAWDAVQACWIILKYFLIDDIYNERHGEATLRSMEQAPRFTQWLLDVVRPSLGGTILEIGAGIGNNVRALMGASQVIATEADPEYIRILQGTFKRRRRVQVVAWDVTRPPPAEILPVDSVLCSNVLEHIEDEAICLKNIRDVLKPAGRVVFVIPNGLWLFGSVDKAIGHFRRYTGETLSPQLMAAGFRVESCSSINKVGVLGWFMNSRVLGRKTLGRWQMKTFDALLPLFRLVDPLLPWQGLSLIVVASRSEAAG